MEEKASRKRPISLLDDEDPNKPPMPKRVRFPKGKKVKPVGGDEVNAIVIGAAQGPSAPAPPDLSDPSVAAKERAKRRTQMTTALFTGEEETQPLTDISAAEVNYEDNADFVDDGIQMEPFNLNQEREEGYFDADGNFVEYANENQIKDAWLDSVSVDSVYAGKDSKIPKTEEDTPDLSAEDIGKMKRRIADMLEPEETVLQALRRLKGTLTGRKEKMPEGKKRMFDQLTEDSMKLMENGDYNVYHDKREVFQREAEGYERIARAKEGISSSVGNEIFPNDKDLGVPFANAADDFDMFAEDVENTTLNPSTNDNALGSGSTQERLPSDSLQSNIGNGETESDYVYDESSGYYYSSALGYYYDPASGLYCSANSGIWYSYNEQTSTYEEVRGDPGFPV